MLFAEAEIKQLVELTGAEEFSIILSNYALTYYGSENIRCQLFSRLDETRRRHCYADSLGTKFPGLKKSIRFLPSLRLLVDIIKEVKKTSSVASSSFLPSFLLFLSITLKHRLYLPFATEIKIFVVG